MTLLSGNITSQNPTFVYAVQLKKGSSPCHMRVENHQERLQKYSTDQRQSERQEQPYISQVKANLLIEFKLSLLGYAEGGKQE